MSVVLIDYGSGNLRSAAKAFERAAQEAGREEEILITSDPVRVVRADRLVLPGVGAFGDCMAGILGVHGLREAIHEAAIVRARPFLGICVGMQLMATRGLEHGDHHGFGWIKGEVRAIEPADPGLKIPHMGWNTLAIRDESHPLLRNLAVAGQGDPHAYFVHSYAFYTEQEGHVLATTDYAGEIAAIVGRDNLVGTQFHPEKSQAVGLALIGNFLAWAP